MQLVVTKALVPRHCLDCCLPCNTAVGVHWQSRGQLWAGTNTALLLTSGPMLQPRGAAQAIVLSTASTGNLHYTQGYQGVNNHWWRSDRLFQNRVFAKYSIAAPPIRVDPLGIMEVACRCCAHQHCQVLSGHICEVEVQSTVYWWNAFHTKCDTA